MTTSPPARPDQLGPGSEQDGERTVRRFVTVLAVTVGGLCFLFSLGNVYQLAVDLELWVWIRPLVAPAADLTLVALVVGIRFLARRGVTSRELRRPRLFMLAVGLAAWALNTAGAVADRDWGKAAFDSLAPGLLIGWAEVLPWFLRQFHAVTHPDRATARWRHPDPGRRLGPSHSRRAPSRRSGGGGQAARQRERAPAPAPAPAGLDRRRGRAGRRYHHAGALGGRAGRRADPQRGGVGPGMRPGSPQRRRPQSPSPLPAGRGRRPVPRPPTRSRSRSRRRAGWSWFRSVPAAGPVPAPASAGRPGGVTAKPDRVPAQAHAR